MIQKTYRANSLSEAVANIKREMGSRAVILSTSKIVPKRSFFRNAAPIIEVIAAVDENSLNADQLDVLVKSADVKAVPLQAPRKGEAEPDLRDMMSEANLTRTLKKKMRELEAEISSLRAEIASLNRTAAEAQLTAQQTVAATAEAAATNESSVTQAPEPFNVDTQLTTVAGFLKENGFAGDICDAWRASAEQRGPSAFRNAEDIMDDCATHLISMMEAYKGVLPRVIGLVGAAGAGKTMSTLKLAHELKRQGKRPVIVTLDVKRMDSLELLKTEAEEMGVPFCVVHPNHTIEMRLRNFGECDHILIDTPSFSDDDGQMRKIVRKLEQAEAFNFLILSADEPVTPDLVAGYGALRFAGVIINRIDECFRIGTVFNAIRALRMPVAYFGIGRNVTDDIEAATPERLLSLLFRIDGGAAVVLQQEMTAGI